MNKIASITVNDEFEKIKKELSRDLQIIQTEYTNSQKKVKLAEQIFQKSKEEYIKLNDQYKKLNDEYNKLVQYKDKCEKYIKELKQQNNNLQQEINIEKNRFKYTVRHKPRQFYRRQRQEDDDEYEDELYYEDDNDNDNDNIEDEETVKSIQPPKKKIKKGISNYI